MNPAIKYLIQDVKTHFDGTGWHAGLYLMVKKLTPEQALYRPAPDRHCIWEILIHLNTWRRYMLSDFVENMESPDIEKDSWKLPPTPADSKAWNAELEKTLEIQQAFIRVLEEKAEKLLTNEEFYAFLRQLPYHDSYHVGQIGLLRVLQGLAPIE